MSMRPTAGAGRHRSDALAPSPDMPADKFRAAARNYLSSFLPERGPLSALAVLGAGNEDIEKPRRFLERLALGGWSTPTWPAALGGVGLSSELASIWAEEMAGFETPDLYPFRIGLNMVGPTVLKYGSAKQQQAWLPRISNGKEIWCQLFSEPGAGSDLAGLATVARKIDNRWEISGQKVWSSRAQWAQWGLLLARCDPTQTKHAGIVCFGVPLDAPGVTVRPLRQMNGDAHFNEVFLESVVVDDDHRIGALGEGWAVARTTLAHEREAAGRGVAVSSTQLIELARSYGVADDPVIRDRLAKVIAQLEVTRWTSERVRLSASATAGPLGSATKLMTVAALKAAAQLVGDIMGMELTVGSGSWHTLVLTAPSLSIRGGTDEIQRGILAERVLGLPKEMDPYRGRPWSEIPRN